MLCTKLFTVTGLAILSIDCSRFGVVDDLLLQLGVIGHLRFKILYLRG